MACSLRVTRSEEGARFSYSSKGIAALHRAGARWEEKLFLVRRVTGGGFTVKYIMHGRLSAVRGELRSHLLVFLLRSLLKICR